MMLKQAGAVLISLTAIGFGFSKRAQLKDELLGLKSLELALEQLRENVCYEKVPLQPALKQAAVGKQAAVCAYFLKAADAVSHNKKELWNHKLFGHELPLSALSTAGHAQERILKNLTEEVRKDRLRREEKLDEKCRSCMSVSAAVSAICAIVLL